jgi:hypothetical protein
MKILPLMPSSIHEQITASSATLYQLPADAEGASGKRVPRTGRRSRRSIGKDAIQSSRAIYQVSPARA